jgi:prepilin signal peptidase PulO-like enzyme (type II secretory pathway)
MGMIFLVVFITVLIGLVTGWLVNYLSDVLPVTRTFSRPTCPECQKPYKWVTYLSLRRCEQCDNKRSIRTWLVFLLFPVASVLIYLFPRPILPYTLGMTLLVFFGVVAIIDLEHRVVLHPVSLFGVVFGLGVGIYLRSGKSLGEGILTTLIGGLAGFCIMLLMAKKKGLPPDEIALGFGDVNLAGILGLMLGTKATIACLFIAILGGGLVSLVIILGMLAVKRFRAFTAIPYAPFLILAAIYLLFS